MNPIPKFLEKLGRELRAKKLREETTAELRAHLEDSAEDLRRRGVPDAEAEELAVYKLGDPTELGRRIRRANRPFYLRFSYLAAAALLVGVPAALGLTLYAESSFRADLEEDARAADRFEREFLEDQRFLASVPFFAELPKNERDAGPYLNPRVTWNPSRFNAPWPELELSRETEKAFRFAGRDGKQWTDLDPAAFASVKTAWLADLSRFDHWEITNGPNNPFAIHRQEGGNPLSVPVPDFATLADFARVRVLRSFRQRDVLPALREVRQLAHLVYSTETLVGSLSSLNLLVIERQAFAAARARGLVQERDWRPLDEDAILRARRALYSAQAWLGLGHRPEATSALLAEPHAASSLCGALQEIGARLYLARPFLAPKIPGESNYEGRLAETEARLRHSPGCRNRLALSYWDDPEPRPIADQSFVFSADPETLFWNFGFAFGENVPFLRRVVGLRVVSFAGWNPTAALYERGPKPKRRIAGI